MPAKSHQPSIWPTPPAAAKGAFQRGLHLAVMALLVLPGSDLAPAQTADLTQKSLEDLMNIEVTSVSRKEQRTSQAAAAVFVISREDISRSGALNIPDLLRMVPGVDVAQIDDGNWAISIRGFNGQYSNKLLVLVDGRTVYNSEFAGVFWYAQNIPLATIERIEVIRGPGAAVWGANAVNGVINVITTSAANTQGGSISGGAGNANTGPQTVRYGGKARNLGAYRVYAEGFEVNALHNLAGQPGQDDWRLVHGGFRSDGAPSARDSLTTEGEVFKGDAGELANVPVSLEPPVNATIALRDRYSGWNMLARWGRTFSQRSSTSLQVYFDRIEQGNSTSSVGLNTLDIDFQHHVAWGARHDIVWGFGYRVNSDTSTPTSRVIFTPQDRTTHLFSTYAQDEITIRPDHLYLSLGARLEHNVYTGFDLEPSAQLAWIPDSKNMVWGAVSGAVRTPARSDTDLRINLAAVPGPGGLAALVCLFGNPNQKNERLTAFEVGYRGTLTGKLSLDSTIFYNRYQDSLSQEPGALLLESDPAPTHWVIPTTFGNGLFGETHGLELFANWNTTHFWTISPGYSFLSVHLHKYASSQDTESAAEIEGGAPDHQAQLRSSLSLPRNIRWNASAYFVNRLPAQSISSYVRLDTGLIWHAGERTSISLIGQNLLKAQHPETSSPESSVLSSLMRRAVIAKIAWTF